MELRKVPAPPPEQGQNVIELRNVREISRAVQYVKDELHEHLELDTADTESKKLLVQSLLTVMKNIDLGQTNSELAVGIDAMLTTVSDLDQAAFDLIAGAKAQTVELVTELESLQSSPDRLVVAATVSEIDAELKRREEMREAVAEIQERFEDERDTMEEQLAILNQHLATEASTETRSEKQDLDNRLNALIRTINSVVETVAENDRKVEHLIAYKNAVKLIYCGLPSGIIGEKLFDFNKKKNTPVIE